LSKIVQRVAYFEINPDRITGQIVYPNGERSRKCYTKWQAKQLVYTLRGIDLDDAEVKALVEAIDQTRMVESNSDIEQTTDRMAEIEAKLQSGCKPT